MKNIIVASTLAIALVSLLAAAHDASSSTVRDQVKALKTEIKEERGELKAEHMSQREDRKAMRTEFKKKLWSERVSIARARIGAIRAHITRLEDVANRLQQLAARRESEGMNVSEARAKITSATTSLGTAKTQLEGIIASFPTERTASTTPGTTISAIQKSLSSVVTHIKSARQDLVDAWQMLRTPKTNDGAMATTTATST